MCLSACDDDEDDGDCERVNVKSRSLAGQISGHRHQQRLCHLRRSRLFTRFCVIH